MWGVGKGNPARGQGGLAPRSRWAYTRLLELLCARCGRRATSPIGAGHPTALRKSSRTREVTVSSDEPRSLGIPDGEPPVQARTEPVPVTSPEFQQWYETERRR